jgi:t-SNARE complex subunit (syntaxin)
LDDTNVDVETADEALDKETRHARHIKEYSAVCWMYIVIILEVIAVGILLILNFS